MVTTAYELLSRTYEEWRADGGPHLAAAMSYYIFLSLSPMLVVIVGVLGRFLGQSTVTEEITAQARVIAGPLGEQIVSELVFTTQPTTFGTTASVIALLVALFGATRVFAQLRTAFDRMWKIPPAQTTANGFKAQAREALQTAAIHNLASFVMVLVVGLLLVASHLLSAVTAFGVRWIAPALDLGNTVVRLAESGTSLVIMTVLFAVIYRFLPRTSVAWRDVWIGALMTSALFMVGRILLEIYFKQASVGSAYGAAGSVVALLVWMYFSSQLVLFGAEFTHVWAQTRGSRRESAGVRR